MCVNISKNMTKVFNDQIQAELASAYLYLSMAAWFEENDFGGFAHWMKKQYAEEVEHAMKMFDYVASRGGKVELKAISAPKREWADVLAVYQDTLAHEMEVTKLIYKMVEAAAKEKDYASSEFLNWFVKEQVEEEETASGIVATLEKVGDSVVGLVTYDHVLGKR